MKIIITIILIYISIPIIAQKDFNYTFFTSKEAFMYPGDSIKHFEVRINKMISKTANKLIISSTTNTADATEFNIKYIGYDIEDNTLIYIDDSGIYIEINPVLAILKIKDESIEFIYY